MEDKIEVEEYVRTKDGLIGKYEGRKPEYFECIITDTFVGLEEEIVKHSKNIIDLIEVGDYVNGERVFKIEKDPFVKGQTNIYFNRDEVNYWGDRSLSQITDKDIKSILTKEQFESMKYEVK